MTDDIVYLLIVANELAVSKASVSEKKCVLKKRERRFSVMLCFSVNCSRNFVDSEWLSTRTSFQLEYKFLNTSNLNLEHRTPLT